jgi:hypothetical protein
MCAAMNSGTAVFLSTLLTLLLSTRNRNWFSKFRGFGRRRHASISPGSRSLLSSDSSDVSNGPERSRVDSVELWSLGDPCMRIPVDAPHVDLDSADYIKERNNIGEKFAALPHIYKQQLKSLLELKEEEEKGWILLQLRFIKSRRTTGLKRTYGGWMEVQALIGLDPARSYRSNISLIHSDGPSPSSPKFPKQPKQTNLAVTSPKPSNQAKLQGGSAIVVPSGTPLPANPEQVSNKSIPPAQNTQQGGDGQAALSSTTQSIQEPPIKDQAQNEVIQKEGPEQTQTDTKIERSINGRSANTEAAVLEDKISIPPRPGILKTRSMVWETY